MVTEAKDKAIGLPAASFVFTSLAITNTSVLKYPEALPTPRSKQPIVEL
jgi:hypothetical protein